MRGFFSFGCRFGAVAGSGMILGLGPARLGHDLGIGPSSVGALGGCLGGRSLTGLW